MIDLTHELTAWLRSTDARTLMKEIVAEAVQSEIRSALEDELIDVEGAAAMLDMTAGALRKAGAAKYPVNASATGCASVARISCATRERRTLTSLRLDHATAWLIG